MRAARSWAANDRSAPLPLSFFYDPNPDFGADPWPFVALMLAGFAVGIAGHLTRSRTVVALGIGMVFLATFVLPLIVNLSRQGG